MRAANEAAEGADVVVFVTALPKDAAQTDGVLRAHRSDLSLLKGLPHGSKVIVVVNKIDQMRDKRRLLSILAELGAVREDIVAVVVMAPGTKLDVDLLRDYCRIRLSAYKVPKRIVEVDDLPRSLIGKVLRREVRNRLQGN